LPPGIGRCNHAERDALAGDATKVGARLKVVSMQAESSGCAVVLRRARRATAGRLCGR
jgi:hypothetical protein